MARERSELKINILKGRLLGVKLPVIFRAIRADAQTKVVLDKGSE